MDSTSVIVFSAIAIVYGVFVMSALHFRRSGLAAPSGSQMDRSSTSEGPLYWGINSNRPLLVWGHTKEYWFFLCGILSVLAVGVAAVNNQSF